MSGFISKAAYAASVTALDKFLNIGNLDVLRCFELYAGIL